MAHHISKRSMSSFAAAIKKKWQFDTPSLHHKFKRTRLPPLQEPKESPYIVGPYLKPEYLPVEYITDPIKQRFDDDLDHFIYEHTGVEFDQTRTIKLLLINDVEGLGVAGQIVEAPHRAAQLVALRKAEYATDFASKWYKFGPKTTQSASSALSPKTTRLLKKQVFSLPLYEHVKLEPWHISLSLRLAGCICPVDAIVSNSIETFVHNDNTIMAKCVIQINNHEKVEVKFSFKETVKETTDFSDLS